MSSAGKQSQVDTAGILVLDKPHGISSMAAVATVRRRSGGLKTGHAGTLDPLATGVLVLALGRATRSLSRVMQTTKRYRTRIDLGAYTETDDAEGDRHEVQVDRPPTMDEVQVALGRFRGEQSQRPPAYSAVKVQGRRAYRSARAGEKVSLPLRRVIVHELDIVSYDWPVLELALHCGKGYYVRSLARDLGTVLRTGGTCLSICREAVGPFTLSSAIPLADIPDPMATGLLLDLENAMDMIDRGDLHAGKSPVET